MVSLSSPVVFYPPPLLAVPIQADSQEPSFLLLKECVCVFIRAGYFHQENTDQLRRVNDQFVFHSKIF